jgi:transcriptional regulator with XRE-family HTH domain
LTQTTPAKRLKAARKSAGYSQAEAAELTGLHPMTLSKIERGVLTPSAQVLFALAELYWTPVTELLGEDALGTEWAGVAAARDLLEGYRSQDDTATATSTLQHSAAWGHYQEALRQSMIAHAVPGPIGLPLLKFARSEGTVRLAVAIARATQRAGEATAEQELAVLGKLIDKCESLLQAAGIPVSLGSHVERMAFVLENAASAAPPANDSLVDTGKRGRRRRTESRREGKGK